METDIHQHRLYTHHHRIRQAPDLSSLAAAAEASEEDELSKILYPRGIPAALSDVPPESTIISTATATTSGSGGWETVFLPFNSFVRTNHGMVVEPQTSLLRQRIRSVGIGLTDRVEGPYDLRIHRIWATNGMSEEEIEEERWICGPNALAVDEGVRTRWGSNRPPEKQESSEQQEATRPPPPVKGLKGLKSEWE